MLASLLRAGQVLANMEAMVAKMEEEYRELVAAYKGLDERQGRGDNIGKALEEVAQAMRESKATLDKMRAMLLGEDAWFVERERERLRQ